jgi:cysteinyl-tRNA synthetase
VAPEMIAAELKRIKETVVKIYGVIGLLKEEPTEFIENLKEKHINKLGLDKSKIEEQIAERKVAKDNKDWPKADEIRNTLKEQGIILFDTKEATTWGIDELYNI